MMRGTLSESADELIIGHSSRGRLLLVCFTAYKKTPDTAKSDEMLAEYSLDYRKARPNRFAKRCRDNIGRSCSTRT